MTDEEIYDGLRGTAAQRSAALKALYEDQVLRNYVAAHIRKNKGSEADIDDTFQEAVIITDRQVRTGALEDKKKVRAYLQQTARWTWLRKRQKWNDRKNELTENVQPEEVSPSPESAFIQAERKQIIIELLEQLDDKCQEILRRQGLSESMAEIAAALGIANGKAAKNAAYRCRMKFRELVKQRPDYRDFLGLGPQS